MIISVERERAIVGDGNAAREMAEVQRSAAAVQSAGERSSHRQKRVSERDAAGLYRG